MSLFGWIKSLWFIVYFTQSRIIWGTVSELTADQIGSAADSGRLGSCRLGRLFKGYIRVRILADTWSNLIRPAAHPLQTTKSTNAFNNSPSGSLKHFKKWLMS